MDGPTRHDSLTMIEKVLLVMVTALTVAVVLLWNTAGRLDEQQRQGIRETRINRQLLTHLTVPSCSTAPPAPS